VRGEGRVEIASEADVVRASQQGGVLAAQLGFSPTERTQVVTAISEVAGNLWLYAGRGSVELAAVDEPERVGITVVARDAGPGIPDVERALSDGYSTRGGMGLGMPGAMRLMDDFDVSSEVGRGTTVTMARWRVKPGGAVPERPFVDWTASPTGDDVQVLLAPFPNGALMAAVAGFGGREEAQVAAATAAAVLEGHAAESPIHLVQRCHEALQGSRGAALALASFSELDARMTWLAIGRVETVLVRAAPGERPMSEAAPSLQGVIGVRLPALRATTVLVRRDDRLVMSSGSAMLGKARFLRGVGERPPPAAR
jgi:anti-sigma regulatory factor (Ser/Thr protein kinase)